MKIITGTGNLSLTGITLPSMTSGDYKTATGIPNSFSGVALALGISDKTKLGVAVYGNDYIGVGSSSSSGGNPSNTNCVSGQGWNGSSCVTATGCTTGLTEITIGTGATLQTWSCKNLGATTVRDGSTNFTCNSTTDCSNKPDWAGDYYQWGRNDTGWTNGNLSSPYNYGWESQNDTKWGGNTSDTPTVNGVGTTNVGRQGPCPSGRHVPSVKDWQDACNTILGTTCSNGMPYNSLIATKIKLPFAGYHNRDNGYYYNQSSSAIYWSSSPNSDISYNLYFSSSNIDPAHSYFRAFGFSIRCLKN